MRFYSLGGLKLALKFLQRVEKGIVHVYIIIQFDCEIKVLLGRKVVNDFNPLMSRVKPWVIQSFLTFDSMDTFVGKLLSSILYWGAVCFSIQPSVYLGKIYQISCMALKGVKELSRSQDVKLRVTAHLCLLFDSSTL